MKFADSNATNTIGPHISGLSFDADIYKGN